MLKVFKKPRISDATCATMTATTTFISADTAVATAPTAPPTRRGGEFTLPSGGAVLFPGDAHWNEHRKKMVWNVDIMGSPRMIAVPNTNADVAAVIK